MVNLTKKNLGHKSSENQNKKSLIIHLWTFVLKESKAYY